MSKKRNDAELIRELRRERISSWIHSTGQAPQVTGTKPDPLCQEAADALELAWAENESLREQNTALDAKLSELEAEQAQSGWRPSAEPVAVPSRDELMKNGLVVAVALSFEDIDPKTATAKSDFDSHDIARAYVAGYMDSVRATSTAQPAAEPTEASFTLPSDNFVWRRIAVRIAEAGLQESIELNEAMHKLADDVLDAVLPATPPAQPQPSDAGWRPIETAPKDGTEVLVYVRGDSLYPTAAAYKSAAYFEKEYGYPDYMEEGWYWAFGYPSDFHECVIKPTHWMPLPAPPAAQE